ncbi:MAG: magnesium chelatase subunit H [Chloroflexota bacterium]
MRFIFITMDGNHAAALREAASLLYHDQGVDLSLGFYNACTLRDEDDWQRLSNDIKNANFVFGSMLFGEEYVRPLEQRLAEAKCATCIITSNPALIYCTRLGKFVLQKKDSEESKSLLSRWAHKFRPKKGERETQRQMAMLRNIGKVLKHIPGKARDLHTYIAVHQYWMHSSPENLRRMLCLLIERYVPGYKGRLPIQDPIEYPDVALFHPAAPAPFADLASYQKWQRQHSPKKQRRNTNGSVGLLSLRTVALSGNMAHLDELTKALERRGLDVRLAYSAGLDFRPAIDTFFKESNKQAKVDLLLNGAGFSLVGGMAESRPEEGRAALEALDVGYLDMIPLSFQHVEEWRRNDTGLSPIQTAMNVSIPELDAAAEPIVYGGPTMESDSFVALPDQIENAAERISRRVQLNRKSNADKKVAVVLFNFPPTLGNVGTAAYLDVFASLQQLLLGMQAQGYDVEVPSSAEELRLTVVEGNAMLHGTDGNVAAYLPLEDYRRHFPDYADIEPFWGLAPGELLNNGQQFYILGAQFGSVFVGIQPSFGYERDPMRLLMAKDAAPHHGFAAFYTWIEHIFGADAVLHFGTHGALEFMPGKQVGMSSACWPTRLLGSLPNFYYYSVNNPSEGTIAKRRGAATLVSYMVPPLQQAGLYRGLRLLKDSLDSYREHASPELLEDIRVQAERLGIGTAESATDDQLVDTDRYVATLAHELIQVEQRMIPLGLHVLGNAPKTEELTDVLALVAAFVRPTYGEASVHVQGATMPEPLPHLIATGLGHNYEDLRDRIKTDRHAQAIWEEIDTICREAMRRFVEEQQTDGSTNQTGINAAAVYLEQTAGIKPTVVASLWPYLIDLLERMVEERELSGLIHALDGGYIPPSPGNDVVRNPAVVPTGRNIHGLDPFRIPTPLAQQNGNRLMFELVERLTKEQGHMPETVALVLWGTDNLKSDGEGVAQVLSLLGAQAVVDELGKVSSVELIPLSELKRPRIDVVVTVSGIFRDLLYHQMGLIDTAVRLAAEADEPVEFNFVRKHALAQSAELNISLDEAATRVFANAPGNYGANVNHLVESSTWDEDGQLGEAFMSRKSFAYGPRGTWRDARGIMEKALSTVDATFQNIDSFELGINDIDHYYEYLGGVTKSVELLSGKRPPVLVAEAIASGDRLNSLEQMVRLESRAKLLNPKWFEAMLAHGYEGVHEIESRVSNTYGWSATADAVEGWVYQGVSDTFLLDEAMRKRLAALNPHATASMARRLLEANARGFWDADEETIAALQEIYGNLEDQMEGIAVNSG